MRFASAVILPFCVASTFGQTPPCTIQTIAGPPSLFSGDDGPAINAYFDNISGFRFDQSGNLYIADTGNQRVREVTPNGIVTTIAGTGIAGFSGDGGPATSAQLYLPIAISPDNHGNLYILDGDNRVRKIDSSGMISTIAGNGIANFAGDGGQATAAEIQGASDLIADGSGNVFIADTGNFRVREVNSQGIISTIAGTGTGTNSNQNIGLGGPATAYSLLFPKSLAVDAAGNVYIGDPQMLAVFKVDGNGLITNYTSNRGANFMPDSLSLDSSGNLAIAGTSQGGVYAVPPSGSASQVARQDYSAIAFNQTVLYGLLDNTISIANSPLVSVGAYEYGNSGDGGPATQALFSDPGPVAVDPQGNVYVADPSIYIIRKIAPDGTITLFAGNGVNGPLGDGGPATQANVGSVAAMFADASGDLYVAGNGLRKIDAQGIISSVVPASQGGWASFTPTTLGIDANGNFLIQSSSYPLSVFSPQGQQENSYSMSFLTYSYAWTADLKGNLYWLSQGSLNKLAADGTQSSVPLPQLEQPQNNPIQFGLTVDGSGNAFISEFYTAPGLGQEGFVQEVTWNGSVFTIARENPALPYANGQPGHVDLGYLTSLVSDPSGNLYFAAPNTWGVRELTAGCPAVTQPLLAAGGVVNAADYDAISLAPGELAAIFGTNLGPAAGQVVPVTSGQFPTQYAGVAVTVNGYPAPIVYVSQSQVNFVVPFEILGQPERLVQMSYNGVASDPYYAIFGLTDPAIFAVANSDSSVNSAANPAEAGSYVVIYGTGQGVSNPPQADGQITGSVLATPVLEITAFVDGQQGNVLYAGAAPGLVAGVLQMNLDLPATITPGQHILSIGSLFDGPNIPGFGTGQTFSFYTK